MPLISQHYCQLNEELHQTNSEYGCSGKRHGNAVMQLALQLNTQDILDYGCGKSTLAENLPFLIKQYDPAIPKYREFPGPVDLVVCTDVLEHIEPDCLDTVLAHISQLTKKVAYVTVATRPAKKILADGRNAHLIIEDLAWWLKKLGHYFEVRTVQNKQGEFLAMLEPKKENK